jgi:lantibiotic modifying enzyme
MLHRWQPQAGDELQRAATLVDGMLDAAAADETHDLLTGKAGAIPVLLALAAQTGDARYRDMAVQLGHQLCDLAHGDGERSYWVHPQMWPTGLGGFSHGVTGMGWALTRLARATGEARFAQVAEAAFRFEDAAFDADEDGWTDLRNLGGPKTASVWCHGSVGIGLAHLDLDPQMQHPRTRTVLQHAARATAKRGLGWNHCLCHGDLGAWELLDQAIPLGVAPDGMTREGLQSHILSSLEDYGPSCGLTKGVFVPGLMPGLGGVAYQLLRMHPHSRLPSVLVLGNGGDAD